ncbi:MAG: hypothetical protein AAGA20_22100 [Planctomycetota bacterium]
MKAPSSADRPRGSRSALLVLAAALVADGCASSSEEPGPVSEDPALQVAPVEVSERAYVTAPYAGDAREGAWRSPIPIPVGAVDPGAFQDPGALQRAASAPEERAAFVAFCERLLLVRDPFAGDPPPGGVARAWFGGLVAADERERHPVVPTLSDVTFALFEREEPEVAAALLAGGAHASSPDAEWAVPRWLALRDEVGAEAFRETLRTLVDQTRGGGPVDLARTAAAFGDLGVDGEIRAWLASPARPRVETSWRYDSGRERLLVRVDQVHGIGDGAVEAYPFTLPLSVDFMDGTVREHRVDARRRRELFDVPCDAEPKGVRFDPERTLDGRVDFEEPDGD